MNWMTGFGYTPNKIVPATVISSTTFTPIGNDTGQSAAASALGSRMYITTITRR